MEHDYGHYDSDSHVHGESRDQAVHYITVNLDSRVVCKFNIPMLHVVKALQLEGHMSVHGLDHIFWSPCALLVGIQSGHIHGQKYVGESDRGGVRDEQYGAVNQGSGSGYDIKIHGCNIDEEGCGIQHSHSDDSSSSRADNAQAKDGIHAHDAQVRSGVHTKNCGTLMGSKQHADSKEENNTKNKTCGINSEDDNGQSTGQNAKSASAHKNEVKEHQHQGHHPPSVRHHTSTHAHRRTHAHAHTRVHQMLRRLGQDPDGFKGWRKREEMRDTLARQQVDAAQRLESLGVVWDPAISP